MQKLCNVYYYLLNKNTYKQLFINTELTRRYICNDIDVKPIDITIIDSQAVDQNIDNYRT